MDGLHFIYFADPMCSWCYGFAPTVRALRRRYGEVLPIRVVMGGLRPGTTEPMPEKARRGLVHPGDSIRPEHVQLPRPVCDVGRIDAVAKGPWAQRW